MKETQELVKNLRDTLKQNEDQANKLREELPELEEKVKALKQKFETSQTSVLIALPELLESKLKETELYEQFYTAYSPNEEKLKSFFGYVKYDSCEALILLFWDRISSLVASSEISKVS